MLETKEYRLDNEAIRQAVDDVDPFLEREKVDRQNALRLRLTLEELLLCLREREDAPESFRLSTGRRFGKSSILLRYGGAAFDPTAGTDENETWQSQILTNLGLSPVWSYRSGKNTVALDLPGAHGMSTLLRLLIAAVAAVAVGIAGSCLPEAIRLGLNDYLLTPLFHAFLGLISTLAGFMIFLTVTSGIFGIGDTASLSRIGKTTLPRFLATAFASAALAATATLPFIRLRMDAPAQGESQIGKITEMIFDILPKNPVRPFLEGNMMQIIVMAVLAGVVLLILGDRMKRVTALIEDLGSAIRMMMEIICKLIPLFVFVSMVKQIWTGASEDMLGLWKPFCAFLLAAATLILLVLLMTCLRTKTSPALLLRKALPAFAVAITTASSMAAFPNSETDCVKQMGIRKKLFDFGFPIGMVVYMPGPAIEFTVVPIFLAETYGVKTNVFWYIMAGFLGAVLSIAVPPTPGAGLTCYGILLTQLNIPMEGMLMAVALNIVFDFLCTGIDVLLLQWELLCQADILHMLDHETLRDGSAGSSRQPAAS